LSESDGLRVLEIGHFHYAKWRRPDHTMLVWCGMTTPPAEHQTVSLFTLPGILWRLAAGRDDLVIVYVEQWAPWHWKHVRRLVSPRPDRVLAKLALVQLLRFAPVKAPLIVIDLTEWGFIHRYNEFLLDKARYWFKRELPLDRWRVFRRSSGGGLPASRFRRNPANRRRLETLRPLSIGCMPDKDLVPPAPREKTADIFVAVSAVGSATVRDDGLRGLRALGAEGVVVDHPASRLDLAAYYERMAGAWLTWSPFGFGADCFRHYEAPLAWSVPVIPRLPIVRQYPLIEGVHCVYYDPDDPEGLASAVRRALADKDRLRRMAAAARELVLAHHVWPDRIDALIRMGLGRETPPGAFAFADPP
jgi:hypothetical protein